MNGKITAHGRGLGTEDNDHQWGGQGTNGSGYRRTEVHNLGKNSYRGIKRGGQTQLGRDQTEHFFRG